MTCRAHRTAYQSNLGVRLKKQATEDPSILHKGHTRTWHCMSVAWKQDGRIT
jgi:hypothetical protein